MLVQDKKMYLCLMCQPEFIRQPEVSRITSIPKSSIPIEIAEGNFPAPVEISTRTRAWLKSEIYDWMKTKLKERDRKINEDKKMMHSKLYKRKVCNV